MRVCYHSGASALQPAQLSAWLTATLALSGAAFTAIASPAVLVSLTDWDYPMAFETAVVADDRVTLGGVGYALERYRGRAGDWSFSRVHTVEIAAWRAWYAATAGFRLPSIVEIGSDRHAIVAPGPFPLELTGFERWGGSMSVREALGWT